MSQKLWKEASRLILFLIYSFICSFSLFLDFMVMVTNCTNLDVVCTWFYLGSFLGVVMFRHVVLESQYLHTFFEMLWIPESWAAEIALRLLKVVLRIELISCDFQAGTLSLRASSEHRTSDSYPPKIYWNFE